MVRLAGVRQIRQEVFQAVKVPATVGVVHLLQAILRAEPVRLVGLD